MYGYEDYELYVEEYSIEDVREDLGRIVKYFQEQDYHDHGIKLFMTDYRQLPEEVSKAADAFIVDEEIPLDAFPEWMKQNSLGFIKFNRCVYWGRCVFPVKDVQGNVMGFCGWDPYDDPKYLDSKNYGYKAKQTSLYGMEKLPEYYTSGKPVFVTEGLMCCLYLRWKGFQALASLGSWLTPYVIRILKRFGANLIMVPDNDASGNAFIKQIKRELPKARIIQVAVGKDIEGCRKIEEHAYEAQLLKELSEIVKSPFVRTKLLIQR